MSPRIPFCLIVFFLFVSIASAQPPRQPTPTPRPGPPIGPREPLYQGDGRLMERVFNLVNVATNGSSQLKSVAVFSSANFDKLKQTAQRVAEKIQSGKENTEEPAFLSTALEFFERFTDLGFDMKQPLGCILQTDGKTFYPLLFMPLDLESQAGQSFLNRIGHRLPDGRHIVRQEVFHWPPGNLFIRYRNGWTFIVSELQFNALPEDPTTLLRGLDEEALFVMRFDLYNMPRLATNTMLTRFEAAGVAQAQSELEKASVRLWFGHFRALSDQADFLELTLSYDEQENEFVLKQREYVRPHTERQAAYQVRRNTVSPFRGFYHPENAIFASHVAALLTKPQGDSLETILDETLGKSLLTEEERRELKRPPPPSPPRPQPQRQTRRDRLNAQAAANVPAPVPAPPDAAEKLAELLALETPEEPNEQPADDNLTDAQKIEMIVRRTAACYYTALFGAVRSGYVDGAMTLSMSDGFMGAYRIVNDGTFRKIFDDAMTALAERYPKVYAERVRKDYAESHGFQLTDIVLQLGDLFSDAWWMRYVPQGIQQQPGIRIVFGVRNDALCFAVGLGEMPEQRLRKATAETVTPQRIDDRFFMFSAYRLGQAIAESDGPARLRELRAVLADDNPAAKVYAVSDVTDTTKIVTFRISGLMTPSLRQMRETLRTAVW